jgi:hypothetical protein
MLRIKHCLMTAACAGLLGLFGTNALGQAPAPAPTPAPAAPGYTTQKVKCIEYVPTYVDQTVTVMQRQQRQETYTAYREECVPQTVTKQVTVNERITETVMETRCVTERVPVQKQVTVMEKVPVQKQVTVMEKVPVQKQVTVQEKVPVQKQVTVMERVPVQKQVTVNEVRYKNVMVTEMQSKTVTKKVQVEKCVDLGPTLHDRIKKICDPCYQPCPRTATICKTERCKETVCCPVTVCKKVAECVPVCKTVCTYECRPVCKTVCSYECRPVTKTVCTYECRPVCKTVCAYECRPVCKTVCTYECVKKQVQCPVTRTRCVPVCNTVTCTVNVKKCVPYQATRCVSECVPVQQTVKVCKMVPRVVEMEFLCPAPCAAPCPPAAPCGPAANACCDSGCERANLLDRLRAHCQSKRSKDDCCAPAQCQPSCDDGCGKRGGRHSRGGDCCGPAVSGAAAGCCK